MIFRQLFDRQSCTYTYLLASAESKEAVIIDPVKENVSCYIELINQLGLKLVVTIDTHLHADHITGTGELYQLTNCQIMMGLQTKAEFVSLKFSDNEIINFNDFRLKAIYTPGHTDDSYCFLLDNKLFTGDTLLIRGTGRTDFQNGCAKSQYDSLFNRLLKLPEDTYVYPGHDYNGMTVSTIGEEKRFNPRLQVKSCEEYIAIMNGLNLPKPQKMNIAVPANLKNGIPEYFEMHN
ncbi:MULTISPECIES: MBL fold metallo-hydrolase [unclassified Legionella]|uniref:MBL fold metallo-hydrolase n=1 Tax=unclassified Legionella TaxID=2622702 RepID=UPI001054A026|nr:MULTISPECIES: MBL fold metallo-hydrolase [unclassified Legionella]MDI9817767.1 MBL fold metallo-hydrolase [Legionella sp. PL877]